MDIHPIRDQIVVTKGKEEEKVSPGGLFMPTVGTSKNVEGTVVTVGSGRVTMSGNIVPLEIKAGDKVLFNPSMANEVQVDGRTFFVMREDAVNALLR
jgi:chaperonin GroES